jgi:hypothetical protein
VRNEIFEIMYPIRVRFLVLLIGDIVNSFLSSSAFENLRIMRSKESRVSEEITVG